MKKKFLYFSFTFFISGLAFAQVDPGQVDIAFLPLAGGAHYQPEYTLDAVVDSAAWKKEKSGMHVSFGSTDQLYFRTAVPRIKDQTASWEATGWKGERINAQLVVWSTDSLQQVTFKTTGLLNKRGKLLGSGILQFHMVRYVLSNYPYGATNAICGESPYKNGYLMPDRFEAFDRFDLPANTVRPVWLSCDIPAGAEAGLYKGTVEVVAQNKRTVLNISVTVQELLLPKPHDWEFRLDLWQNPWVIASYYHVQPWGEEHTMLLKKHLKLYADAGGKYITAYGVHSPWGDNEYSIEEGMIGWIKRRDGTWKFDYHIFDKYVELAMSIGIDNAITIYTPLPWGNRFRYMDEITGDYRTEIWPPESAIYKSAWNIFLNDLRTHLIKKRWLGKTYLGINENAMDQTLAAIKLIRDNSKKQPPGTKEWRITYAGDWHKELDPLLDDYCFLYGKEAGVEETKARLARGATTTYYVCCNPPKPNNFVFSPPIEGRWISWYAAAHGYSGFLRWAYDSWPADPLRDARYGSWAAGDCYLVYPGGNSCIRFEKLREGIVDYEKIHIIQRLAARSGNKKVKDLMNAFDKHLETFVNEKEFKEDKLKEAVENGKIMIAELSDLLAMPGKK